ncbi:RidA family protein [Sphaerotilus sp.]|uniref:RidA family protein n=1 Tax=Sphaerotilus sp. TaxID=2093942 RepID=UPI0034E2EE6D
MHDASPIERLPSSLGYPFSTAVRVGDIWELSGQIGLLPGSNTLAPGGVGAETGQALANIKAVLEQVGSTMSDVIKVGVFLADIADFAEMNSVYATYFAPDDYPARSAVAVSGLALGARVEIECSALATSSVGNSGRTVRR